MLAVDMLQNLILEVLAHCGYRLVEPRAISLLLSYIDDFFSNARSCAHKSNGQDWAALFLLERGFTRDKLERFAQEYEVDAPLPKLACRPEPCVYPDADVIPPDMTYAAIADIHAWTMGKLSSSEATESQREVESPGDR